MFSILKKKSKKIKCKKCGKEKDASEGSYVLGGTTFCCKDCCHSKTTSTSKNNVCEYC